MPTAADLLFPPIGRATIGRWRLGMMAGIVTWSLVVAGCGSKAPPASVPAATQGSSSDTSSSRSSASGGATAAPEQPGPVELQPESTGGFSPARLKPVENPQVIINTSVGSIRIELDQQKAPQTVANFLTNYVDRKAYDGTIVHYVDPTYMVALGGFDTSYKPIATRSPVLNEADNGLKNVTGTVTMARLPDYVHSATSQFFINVADNSNLDYEPNDKGTVNGYCVFGRVVEGMEVVRKIANSATRDRQDFPKTPDPPIVVRSIRRVASPAD